MYDIRKILEDDLETKMLAHKKKGKTETLDDHLRLTVKKSHEFGLDNVVNYLYDKLELDTLLVLNLCEDMIFFHDIAKAQPYFQQHKMGIMINDGVEDNRELSKHSQLSAHIYFNEHEHLIKDTPNKSKYYVLLIVLTEIIAKHHSNLSNLEECLDQLGKYLRTIVDDKSLFLCFRKEYREVQNYNKIFDTNISEITQEDAEIILACGSILYAILCKADIVATKMFSNGDEYEDDVYEQRDKDLLLESYQKSDLSKHLRSYYENRKGELQHINDVRNAVALNMGDNLKNVSDERFFYLEAGVGVGKTHLSQRFIIHTLLSDKKINRVVQALPLLALSGQTYEAFKSIDNSTTKVDSISDIPYVYKDHFSLDADYGKMVYNHQTQNYKNRVITFVKLFKMLFGRSKKDALKRCSLANSVIVLDELQTIDIALFNQFSDTMKIMAEVLNFKVLFMSATLPKSKSFDSVDLVDSEKFRSHRALAKRNMLDFSYFKGSNQLDVLSEIDTKGKRILIHCITKREAKEVYESLSYDFENIPNLELFTSDTSKSERDKIIKTLQSTTNGLYDCKEMILVATNAIEAGVDISMNIAIVDFTMLDSLEQISGRVNRNDTFPQDSSKIYVVNNENGSFLSRQKTALSSSMSTEKINTVFSSKDYTEYMDKSVTLGKKSKAYKEQKKYIHNISFRDISESMELITDDSMEYYDIYEEEASELEHLYRKYTMLMRESYVNYDHNYIKRLEVLKKLDKYKVKVTSKEDKQDLILQYGDIAPIFKH